MKISIITVCYNDLGNLKATLQSVADQSYPDYEHIVIDGGSTDGTREFLQSLTSPHLRFVSEKDDGLYDAMNKGVAMAGGNYLHFLNAGDLFFDHDCLKRASASLEGSDLIYFDVWLKYEDRYVLRRYPEKLSLAFWLSHFLCHQACFYSRRSFEIAGRYDTAVKIASDYDHLLRILRHPQLRWHHANDALVIYDMAGLSARPEMRDRTLAEILRSQRRHLPRLRRFVYGRRVMLGAWIEARQERWSRFFLRTFVSPVGKIVEPGDSAVDYDFTSLPAQSNPLKVLLVNSQEMRGGAAVASSRLHAQLQRLGVSSTMLVLEKNSNCKTVVKARTRHGPGKLFEILLSRLEILLKALTRNRREGSLISPGLVAWSDIVRNIEYLRPDIVHLNWVCGGLARVEDIARIRQPVVWTMHDMWAFCGSEHVTASERFKEGYLSGNRPAYEAGLDLNRWNWFRKRKIYKKISHFSFVGPSQWMKDCIDQSDLLGGYNSRVIPNGLDPKVFYPRDKKMMRQALGVPLDKKVIMFGAVDASKDPNKGFHLLVEALYRIEENPLAKDIYVMVFGYFDESLLPRFSFPVRALGFVSDSSILASAYSCADLMIVPSRIESFGQSATEAMACGVPVVAFNSSGLRDIIDHRVNGFLATAYEHEDLARGILWALENEERLKSLSRAAREKILSHFTSEKTGQAYLNLYREILNRRAKAPLPESRSGAAYSSTVVTQP